MTSLSGSFQTDLALPDALAASAEAIHGLGWRIETVEGRRIVSYADTETRIEVLLDDGGQATDVRIRGTDAGTNAVTRDELIAELDRARDAIHASIRSASDSWAEEPDPRSDENQLKPPGQTRAQSPPDPAPRSEAAPRQSQTDKRVRRSPRAERIDGYLAIAAISVALFCLLLPLPLLWLVPVALGVVLLARRQWVLGGLAVALGIVLPFLSQQFLWDEYVTPSGSMEPTLQINDHLLVSKVYYDFTDPKVGDIVAFHPPRGAEREKECGVARAPSEPCPRATRAKSSQTFLKRVVAGPGDRLAIRHGHPVVNGKTAKEDFTKPCAGGSACNMPRAIRIPSGHYFLMGDNRGSSDDSRFWGAVPKGWITGIVLAVYWPPKQIGFP